MRAFRHRLIGLSWALGALALFACSDTKVNVVGVVTGTIQGTVMVNGSGVSGIQVTLAGASSRSTTTGASGAFAFTDVTEGSYTVSIGSLPSGVSFSATTQTAVISSRGQTVTVSFSGTLQPPGAPSNLQASVSGTSVTLTWSPGARAEGHVVEVTTSGEAPRSRTLGGSASSTQITGLTRGTTYAARVTASNTAGESSSSTISFSVEVQRGTIQGAVTVDGSGLGGITVTLSGPESRSTTTDSSGSYSFDDVLVGSYTVTISGIPSDVTFASTSQTVTLSQHGQVLTVDFAGASNSAAITGLVWLDVDQDGICCSSLDQLLQEVTVTLTGDANRTTTSDATGSYSFTGLAPGSYTVTITNPDPGRLTFDATSHSKTLSDEEEADASFSAVWRPAEGDIVAYTTDLTTGLLMMDVASREVMKRIPLSSTVFRFKKSPFISPDRSTVYVIGDYQGEGIVWVVDLETHSVETTISVGTNLQDMVISADGTTGYVTDFGDPEASIPGSVIVLDLTTNTAAATIDLANRPFGIDISPDGDAVYVAESFDLAVIDPDSRSVTGRIDLGSARDVAITPDGSRAYVSWGTGGTTSNLASVVELGSGTVSTIDGDGTARKVLMTPDATEVSVATLTHLHFVNPASNAVTASVQLVQSSTASNGSNQDHSFTPDGAEAWVSMIFIDRIFLVDMASRAKSGEIDMAPFVGGGGLGDIAIVQH